MIDDQETINQQFDKAELARVTAAVSEGVTFSIACVGCDGGQEIMSHEQAVRAGWTQITYDPTGFGWNFLGHCPECGEDA